MFGNEDPAFVLVWQPSVLLIPKQTACVGMHFQSKKVYYLLTFMMESAPARTSLLDPHSCQFILNYHP